MEQMPTLEDSEIQEKIESVFSGKVVKVLECEKKSSTETEERLLINGFPVTLEGEEGLRIKEALKAGLVPPCELLNSILIRCGILKNPVELETVMNVKSTTKTMEVVSIHDSNGVLLDERAKEIEEDDEIRATSKELWKTERLVS
ncbi:unnamed protein product [Orchesella dallaii]|uniref:Uncharacterized protein n=1 Tax=Orchesella dallaii TaxID=48710 RepID=A0ABP1QXE6_9HEXA